MSCLPYDICPLLCISNADHPSSPTICFKEHCAFFDCGGDQCAIVSIVEAIREASGQEG